MFAKIKDTIAVWLKFGFNRRMVTVIGSARTKKTDKYYKLAVNAGKHLSNLGFDIMTGGGPGIMEAANKGAKLGKRRSLGIGIKLPFEQTHNHYIDKFYLADDFSARKWGYIKPACAFLAFPGGLGTLDELFEILTLIQTCKKKRVPVILVGSDFWQPVLDYMYGTLEKKYQTISPGDIGLVKVCNSVRGIKNAIRAALH